MSSQKFKEFKLSEIELKNGYGTVDGPFGSNLPASAYTDSGVPVIRGVNLSLGNERFKDYNYVFVSENTADKLIRSSCQADDIVFTKKGTLGQTGLVPRSSQYEHFILSSNQMRIRLDADIANPLYVYYFVSSPDSRQRVLSDAMTTGVPKINLGYLRSFKVLLPEIKTQKKIASILSAYDDLIENNKQRIQILENMAEELYKEWFVRFRFPNWGNAEFEKGVPKDWKIINSGEFVDVVKGKSYTSLEIHDVFIDESLPFINLKNFNRGGGYRRNGLKFYNGRYADNQKTYPDDIVMAVTDMTQDRAVVGRVARVPKLNADFAIISLDCVKLVPKIYSSTFTYCYFKYSGFSEYIKEFANGANVLHLSPNQISKQKILLPKKELIENFEVKVSPIFTYLNILEESNEKLEIMRNSLLPRLISGKLSVEDLDIQFPVSMQES